jgi:hypothetical protein
MLQLCIFHLIKKITEILFMNSENFSLPDRDMFVYYRRTKVDDLFI